jgi:hypothetical protein
VLIDTNIIVNLKMLPREKLRVTGSDLDDYEEFLRRVDPIFDRGQGEIPDNVWDEVLARSPKYEKPENVTYTDPYPADRVEAFKVEYRDALGPLIGWNKRAVSDVDMALVAEAWKERKLIASLDWWVIGKAQAMCRAHPAFANLRFGRADTDDDRAAAAENWTAATLKRRSNRRR